MKASFDLTPAIESWLLAQSAFQAGASPLERAHKAVKHAALRVSWFQRKGMMFGLPNIDERDLPDAWRAMQARLADSFLKNYKPGSLSEAGRLLEIMRAERYAKHITETALKRMKARYFGARGKDFDDLEPGIWLDEELERAAAAFADELHSPAGVTYLWP